MWESGDEDDKCCYGYSQPHGARYCRGGADRGNGERGYSCAVDWRAVEATRTGAQGTAGVAAATSTPDIIVTAQKRSERLQDVPIAVSAFSGETLKEQRIESGNQLNQYIPNFSFNRANYGETNFQIRGVGFQLATASGDTGVWRSREQHSAWGEPLG